MARDVDEDIDDEVIDDLDYDLDETEASYDLEELKAMGINPFRATHARPGSDEKVMMLSARYAAGLPLWHDSDCYDHGPHETELMGAVEESAPQLIVQNDNEED